MRARFALAIALLGLTIAPIATLQYGSFVGVIVSAALAGIGIALFPEPRPA